LGYIADGGYHRAAHLSKSAHPRDDRTLRYACENR
jgi:hypothetical protein